MKRVAIQGVAGAFHEIAACKFFGKDIEIVECDTFREECVHLTNGSIDFAVMAIENTIAGSLLPNYSLLTEFGLQISGETYLHIQMHLLALQGVDFQQLKEIWSHPIAIEQCRNYLFTLPPHITIVEKHDTAASAQLIAQEKLTSIAAVAGSAAAEMYGLSYLAQNIQTHKQNFTRFLILQPPAAVLTKNEHFNKASLCFELPHSSGSLAAALGIFAKNNINLTKIQSVPIIGKPYQYWFYVDVEWDSRTAYNAALAELEGYATSCAVLGEYTRGKY